MKKWLVSWWKNYKYRFVPWIALNVKYRPQKHADVTHTNTHLASNNINIRTDEPPPQLLPVQHVKKSDEKLVSDSHLTRSLIEFFSKCQHACPYTMKNDLEKVFTHNQKIMKEHLGFCIQRLKSTVSDQAGTGVFVTYGTAKAGSIVALYPGTIYMPHEPLFFPSLGNPFIFRCSDGIHIDGNDKWISKSIYKSCASRDKFSLDIPCCDTSWLTPFPMPLNVGQYVNNRSRSCQNNVVYQECELTLKSNTCLKSVGLEDVKSQLNTSSGGSEKSSTKSQVEFEEFPLKLLKYIPNVWSDPINNRFGVIRLVPLIATKDINQGDEILSSYFTVVHADT